MVFKLFTTATGKLRVKKIGTLAVTLPGVRLIRVSGRTGWPGVSML